MTSNPTDQGGDQPGAASKPIVAKTASEALRPQAGTPPPNRSKRSRSQFVVFLNFVMSVVVLVTVAGFAAVWYGKYLFESEGPLQTADTVMVRDGAGSIEIAELLERR